MLQAEYRHDIQKNYLVIEGKEEGNYMLHMLAGKQVQGFLPLEIREFDNQKEYYYDITGKESLLQRGDQGNWKSLPIKKCISQILTEIGKCKEYLLNPDNLVLDPAYIYIDTQSEEVALCYVHYYNQNINEQLTQLFSYFMNKLDYQDKEAVEMVYQLYEVSRKPHCTLNDLWKMVSIETDKPIIKKMQPEEMPQEHTPKLQKNKRSLISGTKLSDSKSRRDTGKQLFKKREDKGKNTEREKEKKKAKSVERKGEKKQHKRNTGENIVLVVVLQAAFLFLLAVAAKAGIFRDEQGISATKSIMGLFAVGALDMLILGRIFAAESEEEEEVNSQKKEREVPAQSIQKPIEENRPSFKIETEKKAAIPSENNIIKDSTVILDYDKTIVQIPEPIPDKKQCYLVPEEKGQEIISLGEFPFFIGRFQKDTESLEKKKNVSRMHSKIEQMGEQFYITDLNSTNGTFINEKRIEKNQKIEITEGDKISFADIPFYFTKEWKAS